MTEAEHEAATVRSSLNAKKIFNQQMNIPMECVFNEMAKKDFNE
jgi:hypothetical protein